MSEITTRTARGSIIKSTNFAEMNLHILQKHCFDQIRESFSAEQRRKIHLLADCEQGSLHIKYVKNNYYFDKRHAGERTAISKNPKLVRSLARRRYLDSELRDLDRILNCLDRASSTLQNIAKGSSTIKLYNYYKKAGIDPLTVFFTDEQLKWIDAPYAPNPYHKEGLRYETDGYIPVRSRAEARFGSRFEARGIPYRYDDIIILELNRDGRIVEKTYYADFKIPNFRGGVSVCELLGAFQISNYSTNALEKLNHYEESGAIKPNELFWTFESTVFDNQKLDALIDRMLLAF